MTLKNIKAVIFDLDGTLVHSGLDRKGFQEIKKKLNLPLEGRPIWEEIHSRVGVEKENLLKEFLKIERDLAENCSLHDGVIEWINFLNLNNIFKVVWTRNSQENLKIALGPIANEFELLVGREVEPMKPEPDALFWISKKLSIESKNVLFIGDSTMDVYAGLRASVYTAWLNWENLSWRQVNMKGEVMNQVEHPTFVWNSLLEGLDEFKILI